MQQRSMKVILPVFLFFGAAAADNHSCELLNDTSPMMHDLSAYRNMKIKFMGFEPVVTHVRASGPPMMMVTGMSHTPMMTMEMGQLVVKVDQSKCHEDDDMNMTNMTTTPADSGTTDEISQAAGKSSSAALLGAMAVAAHRDNSVAAACLGAGALAVGALGDGHDHDHDHDLCTPVIHVEIHAPVSPMEVDAYIAEAAKAGQYRTCAAETLYYQHHSSVYGGYAGCTGEMGFLPCEQESHEGLSGMTDYNKPLLWDGTACVSSGYTLKDTTLWILWGYPMDTHELVTRTGLNPVVKFPLERATYPSYPADSSGNDAISFIPKVKEWLVYLGGFTMAELGDQGVELTEGAEAGMVELFGAMAAHIAKTTCNRDIYVLMEAPAYGYDTTRAAQLANNMASSFYSGSECACHAAGTCNDRTVTISARGWVVGGDLPTATDGRATPSVHSADSSSAHSPWFESMVFPENPTGKRKTPQLSVDRRVCDGVYLYPMYFGADDWTIPRSNRPDCAGWSFSITKFYSASVRAGFLIYDTTLPSTWSDSVTSIINEVHGIADGIYSEWSWMGQEQIFNMVMMKPVADPTSWMGAYSLLQKEKWDHIITGFANCPVVEITNPYAGAYAFFKFLSPYLGLQTSSTPSFFLECLGIRATTYSWGFRGADPADFYGAGYGTNDFTRMQLYRDVHVYEEVGRRAGIVCGGGTVSPFMSISEWQTANTVRRRLEASGAEVDHARVLREAAPRLSETEVQHVAKLRAESDAMDASLEANCAPTYTTACLFKHMGTKVEDVVFNEA